MPRDTDNMRPDVNNDLPDMKNRGSAGLYAKLVRTKNQRQQLTKTAQKQKHVVRCGPARTSRLFEITENENGPPHFANTKNKSSEPPMSKSPKFTR